MTDQPIGRCVTITLRAATREHPIEGDLIDALHDLGEKHGVNVGYSSGPLFEDGGEVDRELARYKDAYGKLSYAVEQTLGRVLGYPEYAADMGAPEGDVCTGEHVPETLVAEAAGKIRELTLERDRYLKALMKILGQLSPGDPGLMERILDGMTHGDRSMAAMDRNAIEARMIARKALEGN